MILRYVNRQRCNSRGYAIKKLALAVALTMAPMMFLCLWCDFDEFPPICIFHTQYALGFQ